jgi:uncharacterized protein (TIGR00369 family)
MEDKYKALADFTGLEIIQQFAAGELIVPMVQDLPMSFDQVEKGCITGTAKAGAQHLNAMGTVHGGFSATVLDSLTGCVVHTMLDKGVFYSTIDLNIKMLRPLPMDEEVQLEAHVISMTKNIGVSEASIKDGSGKVLAHATATCFILQ